MLSGSCDQVEVFKTNVEEAFKADALRRILLECFPGCRINFALDDNDRILRVQGQGICADKIIEIIKLGGYEAEVLI